MRLGIMASGRGSNAHAILEAVRDGRLRAEVPALVCNRAGAMVLDVAREFGVPAHLIIRGDFPTRTAQQRRMLDVLQDARVDTVALSGFSAIFRPFFLEAFPPDSQHPPVAASSVWRDDGAATASRRPGSGSEALGLYGAPGDGRPGQRADRGAGGRLRAHRRHRGYASARILEQEHRIYPEVLQWFADGRVSVVDGIARVAPPVTAA